MNQPRLVVGQIVKVVLPFGSFGSRKAGVGVIVEVDTPYRIRMGSETYWYYPNEVEDWFLSECREALEP